MYICLKRLNAISIGTQIAVISGRIEIAYRTYKAKHQYKMYVYDSVFNSEHQKCYI